MPVSPVIDMINKNRTCDIQLFHFIQIRCCCCLDMFYSMQMILARCFFYCVLISVNDRSDRPVSIAMSRYSKSSLVQIQYFRFKIMLFMYSLTDNIWCVLIGLSQGSG